MQDKSQAKPGHGSPSARATVDADRLIDFDDERPILSDELGGEPVDVELSRSSSGAGSSTPRAISPAASLSAVDVQPIPHQRGAAYQPMIDSRASTLAREPHRSAAEQDPPTAWSKPTADILLDLDDLTSPLPLPPTVRRRSPLQVGQWPVIASPPRPHASTPTAAAVPADSSRPPSSQQLARQSPSTTSSIRELDPILGDRRPSSTDAIDDPTAGVFGLGRGSAALGPSPPLPHPVMSAVGTGLDDPADDEFDADDDDELDLRFLPGDFKSTNV